MRARASWDSWGRMMDPLLSEIALMTLPGNHEIDPVSPFIHEGLVVSLTCFFGFSHAG